MSVFLISRSDFGKDREQMTAVAERAQLLWGTTVQFLKEVRVEMKKVTWPDLPQVRSATISIIIFVLLLGLLITLLDFILQGVLIKGIPSLLTGGR